MAEITIRVLEGLERGKVFARLPTPVSIGREDENDIQLNDDRVSRFHAKLQDDGGKIILTDLDSTNGTRVNGHPIQMRVLQAGDVLSIGRCLLMVGDLHTDGAPGNGRSVNELEDSTAKVKPGAEPLESGGDEFLSHPTAMSPEEGELFPGGAPEPPAELRPLQRAQLSDLLAYVHEQVGNVIKNSEEDLDDPANRAMICRWDEWRKLVELHAALARYLQQIANPDK
jgi:predicted component of type VI protein secretion system